MDQFALSLQGTGLPDGDLTFAALQRIAGSMQLLATRIGRRLSGQSGPGRSPGSVESATTLRLHGTPRHGSTILDVAVGRDQLVGEGDLEHHTVNEFFELMAGLAAGAPPPNVTPQIGTAVLQVADALAFSAQRCEFISTGRRPVMMAPSRVERSPWPTEEQGGLQRAEVVITGRLDRVDLRKAQFRLRDAVGNDLILHEVADAEEAARLVGQQVTAVGEGSVGARGQIVSVTGARISLAELPRWTTAPLNLGAATAPPLGGISGITDEDVDEFLALIRE